MPALPVRHVLAARLDLFEETLRHAFHAAEETLVGFAEAKRSFQFHPLNSQFRPLELGVVGLRSVLGPGTKQGKFARGKINLLSGDEIRLHLDNTRLALDCRLDAQQVLQILVPEPVRGNPANVNRDGLAAGAVSADGGPVAVTTGQLRAVGVNASVLVELGPEHEGVALQSRPWDDTLVVNLRLLLQPFPAREALLFGQHINDAWWQGVGQGEGRRRLVAHQVNG